MSDRLPVIDPNCGCRPSHQIAMGCFQLPAANTLSKGSGALAGTILKAAYSLFDAFQKYFSR